MRDMKDVKGRREKVGWDFMGEGAMKNGKGLILESLDDLRFRKVLKWRLIFFEENAFWSRKNAEKAKGRGILRNDATFDRGAVLNDSALGSASHDCHHVRGETSWANSVLTDLRRPDLL